MSFGSSVLQSSVNKLPLIDIFSILEKVQNKCEPLHQLTNGRAKLTKESLGDKINMSKTSLFSRS